MILQNASLKEQSVRILEKQHTVFHINSCISWRKHEVFRRQQQPPDTAWKIPWTSEKTNGSWSVGCGIGWPNNFTFTFPLSMLWKEIAFTPAAFLPGESQGRRGTVALPSIITQRWMSWNNLAAAASNHLSLRLTGSSVWAETWYLSADAEVPIWFWGTKIHKPSNV